MIKENLIFRFALIASTAMHIGGFGLFAGNSSISRNGITNSKSNVVVFEIGWIDSPSEQEKIDKVDEANPIRNKEGQVEAASKKERKASVSVKKGSSGYANENSGGLSDDYLLQVRRRIELMKFYPANAKKRLMSGSVTVGFNIDENGLSGNIGVIKSSGFSLLDETAGEIIKKANPFHKPPKDSASHYIQTTIVFEL